MWKLSMKAANTATGMFSLFNRARRSSWQNTARMSLERRSLRDSLCPSQVMMQFAHIWEIRERVLFPGYIFIETDEIIRVQQGLWRIPYYKRMLGRDEEEIHPITVREKQRLCLLMNDDGVIEASYGYKDGERIEIAKGALVGHEAEIQRIDRHKRTATVEMELLGKCVKMNLGLELANRE